MPALRLAAVQASYVLMDRDATIDRVAALTASAARDGAHLVVFPEAFVPGTPIWIDTQAIWEGDEEWFGLLAENTAPPRGCCSRSVCRCRCRGTAGSRPRRPGTAPPGRGTPGSRVPT
jgi:predicted amidohydrolase